MAQLQLQAWASAYASVLPEGAVAALDPADVEARWRDAVTTPADPRSAVLVAEDSGQLAGLAAAAPASLTDERAGAEVGELSLLLVLPELRRRGHGSRLLAASMKHLAAHGFELGITWVLVDDFALRHFVERAGWAVDGATRDLVVAERELTEVRLVTALDQYAPG